MSYIEKEKLIKADIASIENRVRHAFNQGYNLGFKDGKERTKPLKQEFILDKLYTEIEQTSETVDGFLMHDGTKRTVLQIIEKYKTETEVENGNVDWRDKSKTR